MLNLTLHRNPRNAWQRRLRIHCVYADQSDHNNWIVINTENDEVYELYADGHLPYRCRFLTKAEVLRDIASGERIVIKEELW